MNKEVGQNLRNQKTIGREKIEINKRVSMRVNVGTDPLVTYIFAVRGIIIVKTGIRELSCQKIHIRDHP